MGSECDLEGKGNDKQAENEGEKETGGEVDRDMGGDNMSKSENASPNFDIFDESIEELVLTNLFNNANAEKNIHKNNDNKQQPGCQNVSGDKDSHDTDDNSSQNNSQRSKNTDHNNITSNSQNYTKKIIVDSPSGKSAVHKAIDLNEKSTDSLGAQPEPIKTGRTSTETNNVIVGLSQLPLEKQIESASANGGLATGTLSSSGDKSSLHIIHTITDNPIINIQTANMTNKQVFKAPVSTEDTAAVEQSSNLQARSGPEATTNFAKIEMSSSTKEHKERFRYSEEPYIH